MLFLQPDICQRLRESIHRQWPEKNVNFTLINFELVEINDKYLGKLTSTDSNSDPMLNRYVANSYNEALKKSKQRKDKYISIFVSPSF